MKVRLTKLLSFFKERLIAFKKDPLLKDAKGVDILFSIPASSILLKWWLVVTGIGSIVVFLILPVTSFSSFLLIFLGLGSILPIYIGFYFLLSTILGTTLKFEEFCGVLVHEAPISLCFGACFLIVTSCFSLLGLSKLSFLPTQVILPGISLILMYRVFVLSKISREMAKKVVLVIGVIALVTAVPVMMSGLFIERMIPTVPTMTPGTIDPQSLELINRMIRNGN
ncbi:MAG: hypothetical protein AB7F43_04160 [Bacteriovoracia bacterium]